MQFHGCISVHTYQIKTYILNASNSVSPDLFHKGLYRHMDVSPDTYKLSIVSVICNLKYHKKLRNLVKKCNL